MRTTGVPTRPWPVRSVAAELPPALLNAFVQLGTARSFTRGQVIIAESAYTTEVYLIVNGFVRVVNNMASGDQSMIAIRTSGDLIGELAALDGNPRTSTVIAASRVTARMIDASLFRSFALTHPPVSEAVSHSVIGKLRSATRYRAEAGPASVLTRVARVLEHLADGYGRVVSAGLLIDIPLPQSDLASLVGTSDKGVYRSYAELRAADVIDVAYRRVIVVDIELLHQYADGLIPGSR